MGSIKIFLNKHLNLKIQKPQKYKFKTWEVLIPLIISFSMLILFLKQSELTINDYSLINIKIDSLDYHIFSHLGSSRTDESIVIHSGNINYEIKGQIYFKYIDTHNMYKILKSVKDCQVWVSNEDIELKEDWPTVVGINHSKFSISPEPGIELEKYNYYSTLMLAFIFLVPMLLGLLYNLFIVNNKSILRIVNQFNEKYYIESSVPIELNQNRRNNKINKKKT